MKLRKILVLTLTLLMVLSCTAFAVAETRPLKVALLLTSNLGDKGFYDSAANGLKLIGEAFPGSETKCVEMGQDPRRKRLRLHHHRHLSLRGSASGAGSSVSGSEVHHLRL